MYPTIRAFAKIAALVLILWIGLFILPAPAYAEEYQGTASNDEIYYGYCDDCYQNGPGLRICMRTGNAVVGTSCALGIDVIIRGGDGDDLIRAVDNQTVSICEFGAIDQLEYRTISLFGDDGIDHLEGGPANETLAGGEGDDVISGGGGSDRLLGNAGLDQLNGGPGNDFIEGHEGNDQLAGGTGIDVLVGSEDDDTLSGDDGDDFLLGGTGNDDIYGGIGNDTFMCRTATTVVPAQDTADAPTDCNDDAVPGDATREGIEIVTLNVAPTPEVGDVKGSVDPLHGGYKVTLTIYFDDPAGDRDWPYSVKVDWGDGQNTTHTNRIVEHYYTPSAQKQEVAATITVVDKDNGEGKTSVTLAIPSSGDVAKQIELFRKIERIARLSSLMKLIEATQRLLDTPDGWGIPKDISLSEPLIYQSLFEAGIANPLIDVTPERTLVRYNLPEDMSQSEVELYVLETAVATGVKSGELVIQTYQNSKAVRQATVKPEDIVAFMDEKISYDELRERIQVK